MPAGTPAAPAATARPRSNRVFVSWSGERSKAVAFALRDFIKRVVQASDPWMSSRDIDAGVNWSKEIAAELEAAVVGVIVVTPENRDRPWLNFEAGAISKAVGGPTWTCPFLFDMGEASLAGPLGQFQAVKADAGGTRSLLELINKAMGSPLKDAELADTFEAFWPKLEGAMAAVGPIAAKPPERSQREVLEELVGVVRDLARTAVTNEDLSHFLDELGQPDDGSFEAMFKRKVGATPSRPFLPPGKPRRSWP